MKINFEKLFAQHDLLDRRILIFGNDNSVINRALTYTTSQSATQLHTLTEKQYLGGPEAQVPSLFQDPTPPLQIVTQVTDKSLKRLKASPQTRAIVLVSSTLRTTSSLVKFFQAEPTCLAVGCYATGLLRDEFLYYTDAYPHSPSQKKEIFTTFKMDPDGFYNFLDMYKLCHDASVPTLIENLLTHSTRTQQGDLTPALLQGRREDIANAMNLPPETKVSSSRAIQRAMLLLYELKARNYAINALESPPFFKDHPLYQTGARRLSASRIKSNLEQWLNNEMHLKSGDTKAYDHLMFHMEQ